MAEQRGVEWASGAAILTLLPVAAFQLGWLPRLPDPPGHWFASERLTRSAAAHPLGIPDALLGIASYSVTFALAVCASEPPSHVARKALRAKLTLDGAAAAFNVVRQILVFRRICSWCTATAACTLWMVIAGRRSARSGN